MRALAAMVLLTATICRPAPAQQFPWKPGDPPPPTGQVRLGETLAELDSHLGRPTSIRIPRPGRESRLYQGRGISLIADSSGGVVWVLLFTRAAGELGGVHVGDTRERVLQQFGPPGTGRGELTRYTSGEWSIEVQLDPTSEFVERLSIGRNEIFPEEEFGFFATLKRVARQLYDAGDSAGLLGFITLANYFLWRKYKFWVPRYVHALAAAALLMICWLNWMWIKAGGQLTVRRVIIILLFPAIVYLFFVGAGGVKAALSRKANR